MNTGDLVKKVAKKIELSQALTSEVVETVFATITDELAEGRNVRIHSFGNFKCAERAAMAGRNPRTGEPIEIPAKRSARLTVTKAVKDALNPVVQQALLRRRA